MSERVKAAMVELDRQLGMVDVALAETLRTMVAVGKLVGDVEAAWREYKRLASDYSGDGTAQMAAMARLVKALDRMIGEGG